METELNYIALFFAGAFLCNAIPHLVAGLQGQPFPSPFAKPPGRGNSPALVNFIWGAVNALIGLFLLSLFPPVLGLNGECVAVALGAVLLGLGLAHHFGRVRGGS